MLPTGRRLPVVYLCVPDNLLEFVLVLALVHVLLRGQVRRDLVSHDQVHLKPEIDTLRWKRLSYDRDRYDLHHAIFSHI